MGAGVGSYKIVNSPREKRVPGYLTIVAALILTLLTSFCLTLIEGVRYNGICLEAECTGEASWNSVFAEYHRELAERFNLFAIDASYGTTYSSKANIERHLTNYLDRNLQNQNLWNQLLYKDFFGLAVEDASVTGGMLLTDHEGRVFRQAAVEALADDWNLTVFEKVVNWMELIQTNGLHTRNVEQEKAQADQELQEVLGQIREEQEEVEFSNPTLFLEDVRKRGILNWVIESEEVLSNKALQTEGLYINRSLSGNINQGNMTIAENNLGEELLERFLFQEYLLRYMGNYLEPVEGTALDYQVEYLLVGNRVDRENLRGTLKRICAIREAANAIYLFSDEEKCKAVEAVATLLTTLVGLPELAKPMQVVVILGWAYGESLYDMKQLVAGQPVPLFKNQDTWHYSLDNLLAGWLTEPGEETTEDGMYYQDYLRVLLMFTNLEELTGRSMNLVEADIRLTPGNGAFCLDHCYVELEADISMKSSYGYRYEFSRSGSYQE